MLVGFGASRGQVVLRVEYVEGEHDRRRGGDLQSPSCFEGTGSAFQHGGYEFSAEASFDIGARSLAQQVESDQLGRVGEGLLPLGRGRAGDGSPHRA